MGVLNYQYLDQPWIHCDFDAMPAFDTYQELFFKEAELLEQSDEAEWELFFEAVSALPIEIRDAQGNIIDDLLLHINGKQAWFRY